MKFTPFARARRLAAGQHAVVTGGSSGLGLALARRLAERGLSITLLARNEAALASAAAQITKSVPAAIVDCRVADVADRAGLEAALEFLPRGIDVLVNSAGILREGYFETLPDSDFRDVMETNFFGTLNSIRATLPQLKQSGGRIVNIASVAGLTGVFGYTPYCAAKHALVGFTESLRFELEPQGVRVQLVCPAEFDSPMVDALDRTRTPENREHTLTIPKLGIDELADTTISDIDAGHRTIIPGTKTQLLVAAQRIAPALGNAIARRRIEAVYTDPRSRS
ncbi:SDR family NAD(P)-dependent oxidoreductase [Nocardia fluminea]|uniref:SDR family NAD(P)-dependent oxidoreductase n=1 Tax=Nocardia fluminea TaxID=134984 RepID=UPI003649DF43